MKLEEIGFYTLNDERARTCSSKSNLQRCELILGGACNFKCGYCRGLSPHANKTLSLEEAKGIVSKWASQGLKNVRFSGGEPTVWPHLIDLVKFTKEKGVNRIAISSNGSAEPSFYRELVKSGVNDFSISLDACCADTGDVMAGKSGVFPKVVDNIKLLSQLTYVTVGVVVTEKNIQELKGIIEFAKTLGVSDIRIISAAQESEILPVNEVNLDNKFPILEYRLKNMRGGRNVRGLKDSDSDRCKLVLDDMAVASEYHFPCIIYMREYGVPIGKVTDPIEKIRKDREDWFKNHDTHKDVICRNNCLDVCIDYNNRCRDFSRKA